MGDWILFSTDHGQADRSFHSGLTVDLLRNNLSTVDAENISDLTSHPYDDIHAYSTATSTGWQNHDTWIPIDVVVRPKAGGGWRDMAIHADGKMSTAVVGTCRAYLHPNGTYGGPALDPADGIEDYNGYVDLVFSTSAYASASGTISADDITVTQWPAAVIAPAAATDTRPAIWGAFLRLVTSSASANAMLLRNIRVVEVP